MDDLRLAGCALQGLLERTARVDPVEHQHHIGFTHGGAGLWAHEVGGRAHMLWVVGGERGCVFEVGDHRRLQCFGQGHTGLPVGHFARHAPHQDDGLLGVGQELRGTLHVGGCGRRGHRRGVARRVRGGHQAVGLALLQGRVEVDVDRATRCGLRNLPAAQQGLNGGRHRAGLVVPLGVVAHQRALVAHGVDPVDPGAAPGRVPRPGGAEHEHGHAVAPGVEHGHGGMHQPHVGVHHGAHHASRGFGKALGNGNRHLFVQAQQHLWCAVAQVVDQAVVQAPVAGAGVQGQVGHAHGTQAFGDRVAAPVGGGLEVGGRFFAFDHGQSALMLASRITLPQRA